MNDDMKIEAALSMARKAMELGEFPIGAAVFIDDRIIASASASKKNDRRLLVHAELKTLSIVDNMGFSTKERREMVLYTTL
jgi:tRNA(Arg) A34 adenosine deaminase TadA